MKTIKKETKQPRHQHKPEQKTETKDKQNTRKQTIHDNRATKKEQERHNKINERITDY